MSNIEPKPREDARIIFQTIVQNAAFDLVEQLSQQEDLSAGMTALRETSRFLGDIMFRLYDGTEVPSDDFKNQEELINHLFEYCSKEVGNTFYALLGKNNNLKIMDIHPTHETPQ